MQITADQKQFILDSIRNEGYTVAGYCRKRKLDYSLFYKVLKNERGQKNQASPESDRVIAALIEDSFLIDPSQEAAA